MLKTNNSLSVERSFYKLLLNTNDVLHLLTKKLNLIPKPMGKSIFFLCPFHDDKNPSLSFEPQKKIFTCFSCGFKASDIFDFWAQYKKTSLELALEEISQLGFAEKITPFLLQKKKEQKQKKKDNPFDLLFLISDIYRHNLFTLAGKEVLSYLTRRQVNYWLINRFALGASISNWQITNLLFQSEVAKNLLFTNLVRATEDNRVSDFFSFRQLIIPLTDPEGKIVAFASRKIEEPALSTHQEVNNFSPKYKYLPSYQYYHKSSLLYNYSVVKKSKVTECYLVEGFFDVISLTKVGVENCVALLGTNLSSEQVKLLNDLKKRIVLFLDSDSAGKLATVNITLQLLKQEIDCEIVKYDYQGDPDEICHQFDSKETLIIHNILQKRENPYLFILHYYLDKLKVKENPQRIKGFVDQISLVFHKSKINVHHFLIEKISQLTGWEKEQVEFYLIPRYFLVPHFFQVKHHLQKVIQTLEKKIIFLCFQEKFFWILVTTKNYSFFHFANRKDWQALCCRYLTEPSKNGLIRVNQPILESEFEEFLNKEEKNNLQKKKYLEKSSVADSIFQKIDNIRLFLAKI